MKNPYFSGITCIGDRTKKTFGAWRDSIEAIRAHNDFRDEQRVRLYIGVCAQSPAAAAIDEIPRAAEAFHAVAFWTRTETRRASRFHREPGCVPGLLSKSFQSVACGSPLRRAYRPQRRRGRVAEGGGLLNR